MASVFDQISASEIVGVTPALTRHMRIEFIPDPAMLSVGRCNIYSREFLIYSFYFRHHNLQSALMRCSAAVGRLQTLPFALGGREEVERHLLNRRIYYRERPAIVEDFLGDRGEIRIRADNENKDFGLPEYVKRCIEPPLEEKEYRIDVDLLSPQIWWFREEQE